MSELAEHSVQAAYAEAHRTARGEQHIFQNHRGFGTYVKQNVKD